MKTHSFRLLSHRKARLTIIPVWTRPEAGQFLSRMVTNAFEAILSNTFFPMIRFHLSVLGLMTIGLSSAQDSGMFFQLRGQMPVYSDDITYDSKSRTLVHEDRHYPIHSLDQFNISQGHYVRHKGKYYQRTWEGPINTYALVNVTISSKRFTVHRL